MKMFSIGVDLKIKGALFSQSNYSNLLVILFIFVNVLCIKITSAEENFTNLNSSTSAVATPTTISNYFKKSTEHITELCIQQCPDQNRTFIRTSSEHFDIDCGSDCYIERCKFGCQLWEEAIELPCQNVCNTTNTDTLKPREIYCAMGCQDALNRYFKWLRNEIGITPAPALVADSLTATSLSLEWETPQTLIELSQGKPFPHQSYLVQWRYEEVAGDWKYCRNQSMGENSTIRVDNLQPYTKYRFRIALILSTTHDEVQTSEQSVIIITQAQGVPRSEPAIVRAVAVDHTRISVSWEPGPFPNGPILSYVLQIKDLNPDGYSALKDIPSSKFFFLIEKLESSTNYSVAVSMRNAEGEGPAALTYVATLAAPEVKDNDPQPILILGADYSILKGSDLLAEPPKTFYRSEYRIKGMAIHIENKLLFVSDEGGYIYKTPLDVEGDRIPILNPKSGSNFVPTLLSIDWLNNQLYILGEVNHPLNKKVWQISRCDLDGKGLTIAIGGLQWRPNHFEVDPYNGYLFWVIGGNSLDSGLFRLGLAEISNGIRHENKPKKMIHGQNLGAFTVDHSRFRILVPLQANNTVIAVSLDDKEPENIRKKTQSPKFDSVKSLSYANELFYWTNGEEVLTEEYHAIQDCYYHNVYPDLSNRTFVSVYAVIPSAQPIPIPVNPPNGLEVLLSGTKGKVSWQIPHQLEYQGKGAWQEWKYELQIANVQNQIIDSISNISGTTFTLNNLNVNTEYILRVRAYTTGSGPWCTEFKAVTLMTNDDRSLIWSSSKGLVKTDVLGENVEVLIPNIEIHDQIASDIACYKDNIYFVINSTLWVYNQTSRIMKVLSDIGSVEHVAVDWIGKRLYWSGPRGTINRGDLHGHMQELLPIFKSQLTELKIDSERGDIYFSNGNAVETCRLNGHNQRSYISHKIYSGKQVIGLTLDMIGERVYWFERSQDTMILMNAPMARNWIDNPKIEEYEIPPEHQRLIGMLLHFSNRLFWLQDNQTAVVAYLGGKHLAHIQNTKLTDLKAVSIVDPSERIPNEVNVIPEPINHESIRIVGSWKSFNITWDPVENIDYCQVFYEIKIHFYVRKNNESVTETRKDIEEELHSPVYHFNSIHVPPYTPMDITIVAFTYWGKSITTHAHIHSPVAAPSEPTNPRVFITHVHDPIHNDIDIQATFRWDEPLIPNGPILGYHIFCWFERDKVITSVFEGYKIPADIHEIEMKNLAANVTYVFHVQASTGVGQAKPSTTVEIHTHHENPVPKVLVAKSNEIFEVDMDSNIMRPLVNTGSPVLFMGYIKRENRIFWINENNELFYSNPNHVKTNTKIISITSKVLSFTVDWIDRTLYWSQLLKNGTSTIFGLNLKKFDDGITKPDEIITSNGYIKSLVISPMDQKFYWINQSKADSYQGEVWTYNMKDQQLSKFFENPSETCINDTEILVGNPLTLDTSHMNEDRLIWIGAMTGIYSTGLKTHICQNVNLKYNRNMENFVKDISRLYWTTRTKIYMKNINENSVHHMEVSGVLTIMAYYPQRYPSQRCLYPLQTHEYKALSDQINRNSITLQLPPPVIYPGCSYTLRNMKYTILYREFVNGDERCNSTSCDIVQSYTKLSTISGLNPFTKYQFAIGMNNYYGEIMHYNIEFGPVVVFQTARAAPSVPSNVKAEAISPTEAIIKWMPPVILNSDRVWYEVHWQTENENGVKNRQQQLVPVPEDEISQITRNLTKLLPSHTYSVWIKAYSSNETFTESDVVKIETFSDPENITLLEAFAYNLRISWMEPKNVSRYNLQYFPVEFPKNKTVVYDSIADNSTKSLVTKMYDITGLLPKIQYKFEVLLYYPKRETPYVWPLDSRSIFETQPDRPSSPGKPILVHVGAGIYKVSWEPAKDNGATIEIYNLEARYQSSTINNRVTRSTNLLINTTTPSILVVDEPEPIEPKWVLQYNGTDTYWIVNNMISIKLHSFRVRARNSYGWGPYSSESEPVSQAMISPEPTNIGYIASAVMIGVIIVVVILTIIYYFGPCRSKNKKLPNEPRFRIPDVELASLRNMPRRTHFIQSTNILYSNSPLNESEVATLPQIKREQITMSDFLGSGAFGEVYEGCVINVGSEPEIRVAIKTLRKGATDQEKAEFLQEAQLMSNFQHEHILRLIGVCLDKDSLYIIMELMQGGDLLSYLRQCRPSTDMPSSLRLLDLVSMCEDVAAGCRYLEEMHFVHRDLACRNCLVSSAEPQHRVVKIGDFGLARDIYKNDYYRKEGGLLPVRWMSPESLVDGVFTSQSDVWAFGVLCWEIMTLGQQPYPARNNVEVMHYVREGGRLERPSDCPEELYQLMLKCWSYLPEDRPTFKYCLEVLSELKSYTKDSITSGIFNRSYLMADENHNRKNAAIFKFQTITIQNNTPDVYPGSITPPSTTSSVNVTPTIVPTYLELVSSEEDTNAVHEFNQQQEVKNLQHQPNNSLVVNNSSTIANDGYEQPNNDLFILNNNNNNNNNKNCTNNKNRTFSNSSTVSDISLCNNTNNLLNNINLENKILTVVLPPQSNSQENLTSMDALLPPPSSHHQNGLPTITHPQQKCNLTNAISDNFEGRTII